MNVVDLISKKRDGGEHSAEEIGALVTGYVRGNVPDYQMSAWAMAVLLRGMTVAETAALTAHMLHSGVTFHWPKGDPPKVDKHSTGGIGDKVSLPLAPLLACCDVQVPMISGRGLGATGGTLDKLEAIAGFRTNLSTTEMQTICRRVGCVISGATADLVPADRKLYALRDVTGTVPSIPLITASIMSKKLAEGLDALVLDVKHGSGAFMKTVDQARELARSMVDTGRRMGVPTAALVTDMNQPLGRMAGNAVEVNESIDALRGAGPADLMELTLELGAELLVLAQREPTPAAGRARLQAVVDSGRGFEKFREMVAAQGGRFDEPRPVAPAHDVHSARAGYITAIDAERLGRVIIELGGGRKQLGDSLDLSVGLEMLVRLGDAVEAGQPLMRVFAQRDASAKVRGDLRNAVMISDNRLEPPPLVADRIS
jgi:pyrimidine-nucleoside phosphorylase